MGYFDFGSDFRPEQGKLAFFAAHLSAIYAQLLLKLHTYQFILWGMLFKNNFDPSDSLFSLRLSGFIFRSGTLTRSCFFITLKKKSGILRLRYA